MNTINFPPLDKKQAAILTAFQNGRHMTVQDMLRIGGTTEGRKVVSRLRRCGYDIRDYNRNGQNFKTYYLAN